ncbi:DUF4286 family protein [Flavobacteriaceae bacterium TP-CH-4]|uniref:Putative gamma-glutamylcyclotransferase n=1 Tax=Pelagihabitans pacificus TaxID=2696054 RepID=A0A967E6K7_9FLAO|nr:DUF4286 family protein [Pelagihabitans pacificus]NHF60632.1 DUF4286 family protein [Pelagihabitans pacificus]
MFIYNVTTNIEESVHDEWLRWMKESHIPDVLATGKFLDAKMTKVLVEEELGGQTYSVQFTVADRETLQKYYDQDAARLREDANRLFAGKFVSFRTELQVVSEHSTKHLAATHFVFAYGTLLQREVQQAVFSRVLQGVPDTLTQYRMSDKKVADRYPNIVASALQTDSITGEVFLLSQEELLKADAYEGHAYERTEVSLVSGKKAWIYLSRSH